jgi:hypothetical protein
LCGLFDDMLLKTSTRVFTDQSDVDSGMPCIDPVNRLLTCISSQKIVPDQRYSLSKAKERVKSKKCLRGSGKDAQGSFRFAYPYGKGSRSFNDCYETVTYTGADSE